MPQIKTLSELLDQLGSVATSPDVVAELRERGFTFAPSVQRSLDAVRPSVTLEPAQRRRLARSASRLGTVQLTTTPEPLPVAAVLPEGEYDVVVGLRLAVVTETLAALYEGMRYPRELSEGVDGLFTRERLEALSDDVPASASRIGPLRLTAPLRLAAVTGTENVLVVQEFTLDLRDTLEFGPDGLREITVSSLRGTAQFGVAVRPEVQGGRLVLGLAEPVRPVTDVERLQLTVAADSPIQPRSAEALDAFAAEIDDLLRTFVSAEVAGAVDSISPAIELPIGDDGDLDLTVHDVGVRTHRTDDGGVIVVGVRLTTDALPEEGVGDPQTLSNPFGDTTLNTYARLHEAMFRKIVKQAHASGLLQAAAGKVHGGLRVDGADARLDANALRIILDLRVVNACNFNIDLNVRVTLTYRFSIFRGQLYVTRSTSKDLDNTDIIACFALAILVIGATVVGVIEVIARLTRLAPLFAQGDGDGDPFDIFPAVFDPGISVPGTEVLPSVEAIQALVTEDSIESLGTLSLRPDDINTHIYAQFARRSEQIIGPLSGPPTPLADARVELVDQDRPAPPDDDVQVPAAGTTTSTSGTTVTISTVEVEAPQRDEVLAEAVTDSLGRVEFVLPPAKLRTTAGTVVTTTQTENTETDRFRQRTSEEVLGERRPDIYFRVTPRGGVTFDTRQFDNGFLPNLRQRRIGTPSAPLTFLTGLQGPDIKDT